MVERAQLMDELLPSMDGFVLASRFDMLPWAALEGAAAGLPIIAPSVGGLPEVAIDGETGLLFPVGDVDGLAAALARLADDAPLRERLGRGARSHLQQHHDPDRTYPDLVHRLVELAVKAG